MTTHSDLTNYRFLFVGPQGEQTPEPDHMRACIPLSRPRGQGDQAVGPTYSDYFHAIKGVLEGRGEELREALSSKTGCREPSIEQIDIVSEKHGSDYHPARIRVHSGESSCSFVMNVALTNRGKDLLGHEFRLLKRFRDEFRRSYLPEVYFEAEDWEIFSGSDHRISMFMGDWFDEYHEFHLTRGQDGSCDEVAVWDGRGGLTLSEDERRELYTQTAYVLTYYYHVETFEEVYPWHHASGDFVVRRIGDALDVKLVTARQYAPRVEYPEVGPETRIEALWLFLANLTLRNRLDRIDGVGETVMAGDYAVDATLRGVAQALATQVAEARLHAELLQEFVDQAGKICPADLAGIFGAVVSSYPDDAPDVPIIREHLINHVLRVYQGLRQWPLTSRVCRKHQSPTP